VHRPAVPVAVVNLIAAGALTALVTGCGDARVEAPQPPITVFAAASLARPLRALADTFQRRHAVASQIEFGGSLDQARKITDLARTPDVLMLVDDDIMASLLTAHYDWYVRFATGRIVVAYTPRSRLADSLDDDNWWEVLARAGVRVGRADPATAPAGRHALGVLNRAEGAYARADLAEQILARSPERFVRPTATELAALLETGEVDYILEYEAVAQQHGFRIQALPAEVSPRILYGVTVPRAAAHRDAAVRFVAYALSGQGRDIMRAASMDVLPVPVAIGTNVPSEISEIVRTLAAAAATDASR
jgi:molybdate/tungstate transport system substrate-binding protein